jgi:hypothetical protein
MIVTNECGVDSIVTPVSVIGSSTDESSLFGQIKIAPNPSSGQFNLVFQASFKGDCRMQITDMTGRRLMDNTEYIADGNQVIPFDLVSLADGMYTFIISENKQSTSLKFVILRK